MCRARRADEWERWSELLALTHNVHCDGKTSKPIKADAINIYPKPKPKPTPTPGSIKALKVFLKE